MVTQDQIQSLCKQIVDEFHPEKIILFGSHAYGLPRADSDVDLLIVMPFEGSAISQAIKIMATIKPHIAVDLIVRTTKFIKERIETRDGFIKEITERRKITYEAKHA